MSIMSYRKLLLIPFIAATALLSQEANAQANQTKQGSTTTNATTSDSLTTKPDAFVAGPLKGAGTKPSLIISSKFSPENSLIPTATLNVPIFTEVGQTKKDATHSYHLYSEIGNRLGVGGLVSFKKVLNIWGGVGTPVDQPNLGTVEAGASVTQKKNTFSLEMTKGLGAGGDNIPKSSVSMGLTHLLKPITIKLFKTTAGVNASVKNERYKPSLTNNPPSTTTSIQGGGFVWLTHPKKALNAFRAFVEGGVNVLVKKHLPVSGMVKAGFIVDSTIFETKNKKHTN